MGMMKNTRCCVCGEKIISEEDLTVCENCNSLYHKICWQVVNEKCICCHKKIQKEENNYEGKIK